MVGVPGRSRACQSCRRRKISCDRKTPRCNQCKRYNQPCDFSKPRVFVVNDQGTYKTTYRKPSLKHLQRDGSEASVLLDPHSTDRVELEVNLSFQSVSSSPQMMQQITACAISDFSKIQVSEVSPSQLWAKVIASLAVSPGFADASLLAFYIAWRAREVEDTWLQQVGRQFYTKGLAQVRSALNDKRTALDDSTLASCLALVTYEVIECPDSDLEAYYSHVEGCERLIKLRGPERHQDGVGHHVFVSFRILSIMNAYRLKRRPNLFSQKWQTIPWKIHPKNIYDRLLDILARGPDMLLKADLFAHAPNDRVEPLMGSIWADCIDTEEALSAYHDDLTADLPTPLYWEEPKPQPTVIETELSESSYTDELLGTIFNFSCREAARNLTLYWAIQTMLQSGMEDLYIGYQKLNLEIPDQRQTHLDDGRPVWLQPVHNICKSVEYCIQTPSFYSGSLQIANPLALAISVMAQRSDCEREYRIALNARKYVGRRWFGILEPRQTYDR